MIKIKQAIREIDLRRVRRLIRFFVDWHKQRHLQDVKLIDEYFDASLIEKELAGLPGKYAPPKGSLLLATYDGHSAGCVALREIDADSCEMKRMFVYKEFHGKGIGQELTRAIIEEAKRIGYTYMKLDTSIRQKEAQGLYEKMGFTRIKPYYELPKQLEDWLVFMELKLK